MVFRHRPLQCLLIFSLLTLAGCSFAPEPPDRWPPLPPTRPPASLKPPTTPKSQDQPPTAAPRNEALARMGHTIQVGAFVNLDNAVRLERLLQSRGLDAYYFRHESGLYKVRFGNHRSREAARQQALALQQQGLIEVYYLVPPELSAAVRMGENLSDLRSELVKTALGFVGVPYRWGGTDDAAGFDCSGLTMVSYRLSGLDLPRSSVQQFDSGVPIEPQELQPADLVFFATRGGDRVSHVGMYIGAGQFVHAPRTGQSVRTTNLNEPYYQRTYRGARSYF